MAKKGRMSNDERRLYIIQLIKDYKKDKKNFINALKEKYLKQLESELKDAAYFAVEEYYEYPTEYHRKKTLFDAYEIKVDVKKNIISVEFGPQFGIEEKHPNKGEYIYEWMFGGTLDGSDPIDKIGGWHGGDIHPKYDVPWLRKGSFNGNYTEKNKKKEIRFLKGDEYWLREASRTESPYLMILDALQEVTISNQQLAQEELDDWMEKRLGEIEKQIRIFSGGGN